MRLGVVSDTHGHMANTLDAVRMLDSLSVDTVFHCGDIGSVEIVPLFAPWPTHFVLGNVDNDEFTYRQVIEQAGQTFHGRFGSIELAETRIALLHGDNTRKLSEVTEDSQWHLVCHGHTHIARADKTGNTLVLNPGAMVRVTTPTIAIVELPSLQATHVDI